MKGYTYYMLILFAIIIVYLLHKKELFNSCNYLAKGETKSQCVSECLKDTNCESSICFSKCDNCDDKSLCKWVPPDVCEYEPKGSNIIGCVDECLGENKFSWGGDACSYKICKKLCDNCQDSTRCIWRDPKSNQKKCEYQPWGPSEQACVDRCVSEDRTNWGGDLCDKTECTKICEQCDNNSCEWKKPQKDEVFTLDMPPPQRIRVISGILSAKVQWYIKENKKYPNTNYLIYYFKSYKPFEGVTIKHVDKCSSNSCSVLINQLDNEENYSFCVYALNSNGKGPKSNIVDVLIKTNNNILK